MEIRLLDEKIEITTDYFFIAIVSILIVGIPYYFLGSLISSITPIDNIQSPILTVILYLLIPVAVGFIAVALTGAFNKEKNEVYCRSIAFAFFILAILVFVISGKYYISFDGWNILRDAIEPILYTVAEAALSSFNVFLFMMLFIKPNLEKIKKSAILAIFATAVFFFIYYVLNFIIEYNIGRTYIFPVDQSWMPQILEKIILSFIIIYNFIGRKTTKWDYIYAGLFISFEVLNLIVVTVGSFDSVEAYAWQLVWRLTQLGSIYLVAKNSSFLFNFFQDRTEIKT